MDNKFVAPEDISGKMGNKKNLYEVLKVDRKNYYYIAILVGLFLPPYEKCSTDFLKDLLAKRKPVSN